MGALPEDEFAAVDDVLLEEDNTKTVKAAMSKLGMSNLKDELLTQLKLGHAVTMPKEHLAKFVATRAKWYRSLGAPLHIDAYDKWICWPIGCVKAKCGINNAYNLQRAKEEYRKMKKRHNCMAKEHEVKVADWKKAVAKAKELKKKEKKAKKEEKKDKAAKKKELAGKAEKKSKELAVKEKQMKEKVVKAAKMKKEKATKEKEEKEEEQKWEAQKAKERKKKAAEAAAEKKSKEEEAKEFAAKKKEKADKAQKREKAAKKMEKKGKELKKKEKKQKEKTHKIVEKDNKEAAAKEKQWKEKGKKEVKTKEGEAKKRAAAAEKKRKEKEVKAEKKSKELKKKEAAVKKKEKADKKKKKLEAKAKKEEKQGKELKKKETAQKKALKIRKEKDAKRVKAEKAKKARAAKMIEKNNKAIAAKERKSKAKLTCITLMTGSNKAGVIRAKTNHGYISLGGGMVNHYRHWNKLAGFEEAMPEGNHFRCDTGFGPGRLSCYNRQCKTNVGALKCITRSTSFKGSGVRDARLPAGYVMTGGGLYNHYRHWNKRAGFEETRPNGNAWRGDMGFGWGHYTVYVRGCKAPKGHKLTCVTRQSGRGNYNRVACPRNYAVTSCGVNNHYRSWNSKSGYESHFPASSTECHCDTAFGAGDNTCYARCCKLN